MPPDHERDYEVGYGKPPHHTRFTIGRSGNPRERHSLQCATAALQAAPCCSSINRALTFSRRRRMHPMIIRFDGKTVVVERSWNGFGRCICFIGCICVRLRCILCAALRLPGSRRFVPDSLLEESGFELPVPPAGAGPS